MDLLMKTVDDPQEAQAFAELLDRYASETTDEFRDHDLPAGVGQRLVERHFGAEESVLVVARIQGQDTFAGLCLTIPFEDPLMGTRVPFVAALWVEPDYRHRGLAKHLVDAVSSSLEERGIHQLAARAGHNDDALISMGERWGFVRQWEWMVRE